MNEQTKGWTGQKVPSPTVLGWRHNKTRCRPIGTLHYWPAVQCYCEAIIRLEAAWRHRLACVGEAACRPAAECYRRRQTMTTDSKTIQVPPTLCVGGPIIITRTHRLAPSQSQWVQCRLKHTQSQVAETQGSWLESLDGCGLRSYDYQTKLQPQRDHPSCTTHQTVSMATTHKTPVPRRRTSMPMPDIDALGRSFVIAGRGPAYTGPQRQGEEGNWCVLVYAWRIVCRWNI